MHGPVFQSNSALSGVPWPPDFLGILRRESVLDKLRKRAVLVILRKSLIFAVPPKSTILVVSPGWAILVQQPCRNNSILDVASAQHVRILRGTTQRQKRQATRSTQSLGSLRPWALAQKISRQSLGSAVSRNIALGSLCVGRPLNRAAEEAVEGAPVGHCSLGCVSAEPVGLQEGRAPCPGHEMVDFR